MRQVFFFALFIVFLFVLFFLEYFYQPLKPEIQDITVQVVYHETTHNLELEAYSTLEEALSKIELKDDVLESALNYNQILSHRDVINIPLIQEIQCVSINYGSLDELITIKGVGPKTAESIIDYRDEFGSFQTLEDLLEIRGIGEKKLESMKDSVCL